MLTLKDKAEIYRIGLITGYFNKEDIIKWADKIIETQDNFEYEIIEISLLTKSKIDDIALKLFELKGEIHKENVLNVFLGLCAQSLISNKLNEEKVISILDNLHSSRISLSDDIVNHIIHLSDGYFLASQRIYGEIKYICDELKQFLEPYIAYADEFNN